MSRKQETYLFLQNREKLKLRIMPNHKKCIIQKQNFMLFFVLFLAAGSARYGTANEEASGDGSPPLNVAVTPTPETSAVYFTTAGDRDLKPAIKPTEIEIDVETGNNASTELNSMNNDKTPETAAVQPALMFGIPVVILVLLILLIVFFVIRHKRKKSKQDELGSENVKSPIFEEDTPSVMEIEMEELDKWMNSMNKNADGECLPTVKEEEKESNVFTSDCES
ncbi:transmembrane protein 154 [Chelonoidis abingdonii]|uniref:transmembrane protein 154 n=1 Tax=Chelonoidis abingdonii TaxID=106734 RepID=UPI0013F2527B|nr:transmembrane protein 154 [Chelonoidis abingdonii]